MSSSPNKETVDSTTSTASKITKNLSTQEEATTGEAKGTSKQAPDSENPSKGPNERIIKRRYRRTKKWSKPKDKPTRPLSAYNIFFKHQRTLMLGDDVPSQETEKLKMKIHCKTHGKIGFAELAKDIAAKWKALDSETRKDYDQQAQKDKERYLKEVTVWEEERKLKKEQEDNHDVLDDMAAELVTKSPAQSGIATRSEYQNTPPRTIHSDPTEEQRLGHSPIPQRPSMPPTSLQYRQSLQEQQHQTNFNAGMGHSKAEHEATVAATFQQQLPNMQQLQQQPQSLAHPPQVARMFDSTIAEYPNSSEESAFAFLQRFQNLQNLPRDIPLLRHHQRPHHQDLTTQARQIPRRTTTASMPSTITDPNVQESASSILQQRPTLQQHRDFPTGLVPQHQQHRTPRAWMGTAPISR